MDKSLYNASGCKDRTAMMQSAQRIEPEHWCTGQVEAKKMRTQNCL